MINILLASILFTLVLVCNLTSISIFLRCRLMISQMRVILLALSQQAVVYSILALLACIIMLVNENQNHFPCLLFRTVLSAGVMTPLVLSTYMSLDKYMSLKWPFWHARVITTKLTVLISATLVFSTFTLRCILFTHTYLTSNILVNNECYTSKHVSTDLAVEAIALTFCFILAGTSWIGIICHIKKYTTKVIPRKNSRENISQCVETFQMLILIFSVNFMQYLTVIPIYILAISQLINTTNHQLEIIDRNMRIGFFLTVLINPIIYTLKFRECHYHVLKLFCFCSKRLQDKAERLESVFRLEHARIPTPAVSHSHNPLSNSDKCWQIPKTPTKNLFSLQIPDKEQSNGALQIPDLDQHKWKQKRYNEAIKLFVKTKRNIP